MTSQDLAKRLSKLGYSLDNPDIRPWTGWVIVCKVSGMKWKVPCLEQIQQFTIEEEKALRLQNNVANKL